MGGLGAATQPEGYFTLSLVKVAYSLVYANLTGCQFVGAERYETDSIEVASAGKSEEGAEAGAPLNATTSLLDLETDAGGAAEPAAPGGAGAAGAGGSSAGDLLSLGGGPAPGAAESAPAHAPAASPLDLLGDLMGGGGAPAPAAAAPAAAPAAPAAGGLDLGLDLLGGLGAGAAAAPPPPPSSGVTLRPQPQITPQVSAACVLATHNALPARLLTLHAPARSPWCMFPRPSLAHT